ncbi:MptD family putative ECF transporter S component [Paenibacillus sp. HW567]|uniref:MptD family putative ECF transporter S component n=1 Tax=Paenibacillus sp. HW567 TaxID=1034769 RepID=UPI000688FA21|nr:MptD family putative ECF transporter S component [Paenibacillus sp. HW567]
MTRKLKTKDYILIGIFSILIYAVNAVVGSVLTPFMGTSAMPLIAGFCLFFSAIVYLIMALKIAKRGVLLVQCIVSGLVYTLMGIPLMLAFFTLAGCLGEAVLLRGDGNQYRKLRRQSLAYATYGCLYGLGSSVTIYIYGGDYLTNMFAPDTLERMLYFAYSPVWITVSIVFSFAMTLLGSWFASRMLNKHFIKAGVIR